MVSHQRIKTGVVTLMESFKPGSLWSTWNFLIVYILEKLYMCLILWTCLWKHEVTGGEMLGCCLSRSPPIPCLCWFSVIFWFLHPRILLSPLQVREPIPLAKCPTQQQLPASKYSCEILAQEQPHYLHSPVFLKILGWFCLLGPPRGHRLTQVVGGMGKDKTFLAILSLWMFGLFLLLFQKVSGILPPWRHFKI